MLDRSGSSSLRSTAGRSAVRAGASWEDEVFAWLTAGGFLWRHVPGPVKVGGRLVGMIKGVKGCPDVRWTHPTRCLSGSAECKSGTARVTAEQRAWIASERASGDVACVWRDTDRVAVKAFLVGTSDIVPGAETW
jgi:hypothetical protein